MLYNTNFILRGRGGCHIPLCSKDISYVKKCHAGMHLFDETYVVQCKKIPGVAQWEPDWQNLNIQACLC